MYLENRQNNNEAFLPMVGKPVDKIKRFNWVVVDEPGTYEEISKEKLIVDLAYQRDSISKSKVLSFARSWSWISCNTISVAKRDNNYYVLDGQHRKLAADKRSDIDKLPCMVHRCLKGVPDEADKFIKLNTTKTGLKSADKFKALVASENVGAVCVKKIIEDTGYFIARHGSARGVGFPMGLLKSYERNKNIFERIWKLYIELMINSKLEKYIFEGLFYIEEHIILDDKSLLDKIYYNKLIKAGESNLTDGIKKSLVYHSGGGSRSSAKGILNVLNKGRKFKLELD